MTSSNSVISSISKIQRQAGISRVSLPLVDATVEKELL